MAFSLWVGECSVKLDEDVVWTFDALVVEMVEVGAGIANTVMESLAAILTFVVLGHGPATVFVTLRVGVGPGLCCSLRVGNCIRLCLWDRVSNSLRKDSGDGSK